MKLKSTSTILKIIIFRWINNNNNNKENILSIQIKVFFKIFSNHYCLGIKFKTQKAINNNSNRKIRRKKNGKIGKILTEKF